jgi:glycosidase
VATSTQRFYLIGETFDGDKSLLKSFVDPSTKLDGQFDFPLRAQLVKNILMRQGALTELDTFLNTNDGYYGASAIMGTFLGNHDLPRSIHFAEDSPLFTEWDTGKSRGWNNKPSAPTDTKPYERLAVAFTAMLTLPGLPMIYYGDEIGMHGAGDPDNRHFMVWSGTSTAQDALRAHLTKLTAIRKAHSALRRGTRQQVWLAVDVYGYRMSDGSDQLIVVLNRSDVQQTIQLTGASSFKDLLSNETVTASAVKIPARSSRILQ